MKIIEKDLLSVEEGYILDQRNCFVMGSGVAKAIIDKYPIVLTQFNRMVKRRDRENWKLLGDICPVSVGENLISVGLFGQYDYGTDYRRTEYGSFAEALKTFRERYIYSHDYISDYNIGEMPVYMPYKIGCDRGGGDWNIIQQIVEEYLPQTVFCKLPKK